MNKKVIIGILAVVFPLIIFITFVGTNGSGVDDKLSKLLARENGNINDVFHQYALDDVSVPQTKVTMVKDLKDFRRYLFFMPKVHFIATSAEEAKKFEVSFPESCQFAYSNQPKWMLNLAWMVDLFDYYAVFTCHKMKVKL